MIDRSGERRPSAAYLFTLGIGLTGLVFSTIAVEATTLKARGLDPSDTFENGALYAIAVAVLILFGFRLIFSKQVSGTTQSIVRVTVIAFMSVLIIACIASAFYVFSAVPGDGSTAWPTMIVALLSQFGTLTWLLRFRQE